MAIRILLKYILGYVRITVEAILYRKIYKYMYNK